MPIFLDTRGRSSLGIAVCARCGIKHSRDDLHPDPNAPGLYVCDDDLDQLDPYRLAPRETENITMEWCRPDAPIAGVGATHVFVSTPGSPIALPTTIQPTHPWAPQATYSFGASVTPLNENNPNVTLPQYQFVCTVAGVSGALPPAWPRNAGVVLADGTVTWLCVGIYLDQGVGTAFPAPQPSVR